MTDLANKNKRFVQFKEKEVRTSTQVFVTQGAIIIVLAIFGYYIGAGNWGGAISALIIIGFIWWSSR